MGNKAEWIVWTRARATELVAKWWQRPPPTRPMSLELLKELVTRHGLEP